MGLIAVVFGAFSAHGLEGRLDESSLNSFKTAVEYQLYHVLAILIMCSAPEQLRANLVRLSMNLFIIGILLFCGSIYLLSTSGEVHHMQLDFLGPITPVGGAILISGWFVLIVSAIPERKKN
ncbi:MAG: DUF423 domain-containing protein [Saprospirales bacterium]|nr:MAG: DUF423 domain-containing protein [Saprospirales bacterium]